MPTRIYLKNSASYDVTESVQAVADLVNSALSTQKPFIVVTGVHGGQVAIQAPLVSTIEDVQAVA
jgi:hypothetical protein